VCVCVSSPRAAQPTQHPGGLAPFFLCAGRTRGKKGLGTGFCFSKLPYMCTARHTCRFWWCAIVSRSVSPDLYYCKKKGEGQGRKSNRESTPTCISPDTQPYTPPPFWAASSSVKEVMAVDVVAVAAVLVSRFTSLAAISSCFYTYTYATRFPASPIAYGIVLCLFEVHTWQMSRRGSCQPPVDHKHSNKHSQFGLAETLVHQQKNQHQQHTALYSKSVACGLAFAVPCQPAQFLWPACRLGRLSCPVVCFFLIDCTLPDDRWSTRVRERAPAAGTLTTKLTKPRCLVCRMMARLHHQVHRIMVRPRQTSRVFCFFKPGDAEMSSGMP